MRPQDIAILIKILSYRGKDWNLVGMSNDIKISISEISESLQRSYYANLVDKSKRIVFRQNFWEFVQHGIRYVFPQQPGGLVRGIPTAHSHPMMKQKFISDINYVWPDINGWEMGLKVEPFYPKQVEAVKSDLEYYKLLALIDVIRIGKVREIKYASDQLKQAILYEPSN